MPNRLQQLWIPGFFTLIPSALFLMTLQKLRFQPSIVWSGSTALLLYVPWLVSLPFFGALGAYVSSPAGGSRGTVLLASVFPVLALTAALLLMFPIGMLVERITGNHVDFGSVATALLKDGIGWILVPGAALLAGGALAHSLYRPRSSSATMAIGQGATMPDWRAWVTEHFSSLRNAPAIEEEVVRELEGDMEEHYAVLRAEGLGEDQAFAETCARAGDWEELRSGIESARQEETMIDRVKQIWIPSLLTLFAGWGALALLIWAGVRPFMTHPGEPRGLIVCVPWLLLLPVIGAVGGYLSRRAKGTGWHVYVAGLFPVLAIAGFLR